MSDLVEAGADGFRRQLARLDALCQLLHGATSAEPLGHSPEAMIDWWFDRVRGNRHAHVLIDEAELDYEALVGC